MYRSVLVGLLLTCGLVHAQVSLPNGVWNESVEDVRVKVLGGSVVISRGWLDNRWQLNPHWNVLKFNLDALDGSVKSIDRNGSLYERRGDAWVFDARTLIRKQAVSVLTPGAGEGSAPASLDGVTPAGTTAGGLPVTNQPGYRWLERGGDWIDYDASGRIVGYGDRNDVRVWIEYGSGTGPDAGRIRKVRDHFGRSVLTWLWTGDKVTEIRDNPALMGTGAQRIVKYQWAGQNLLGVTDVLGNATAYAYEGNRLKTATDPEGRTRSFTYGPTGRIASVKEADGATTGYVYDYNKTRREFYVRTTYPATAAGVRIEETWYDGEGRPIRSDVNGKTQSTLAIDTGARTRTSADAQGRNTITTLDEFDNVVKMAYPDGSSTSAKYSAAHNGLLEETDELGVKTTHEYDGKGNRTKTTEALGLPEQRITDYTLNAFGLITAITRKGGAVSLPGGGTATIADTTTQLEYDLQGNPIRLTDGEGKVTQNRYSIVGLPVQVTDPKGGLWTYDYNARGQLVRETDPLSHSLQYAYDKSGHLLSQTDALGNKTEFAYDAAGRMTRRTDALGAALTDEFSADGQLVARTDASGKRTRMSYDLSARIARATDGKGFDIAFDYTGSNGQDTGEGKPGRIAYPTFERRYRYDERGRVNQETEVAGSEGLVSSYAYDRAGRAKSLTNPDGKTRTLAYDALGRTTRMADPLGNTLVLTYDQNDNVIALTDPLGNTTRFEYDRRGLLVRETDPLGNAATYAYDANGWQSETRLANGKRIAYARDAAGRLTERRAYDTGDVLKETVTYTYDAADRLTGWSNGSASATLTYDAADRPTGETLRYASGVTLGYQLAYHANGQVKSLTYPDGRTATYGYDANGQLESIDVSGEGQIAVTDWKWVQPRRILYPGGTVQERDHDDYLRLTRVRVTNPTQQTVFDLEARYGKLRNVAERKINGDTTIFSYDAAERLDRFDAGTFGALSQNYTLDAAGNRVAHSRVSGTWTYDAANQLKTRGNVSYSYDTAGNLIKKIDPQQSEPQRTTEYRYDALNRLAEVIDGAGNPVARYTYDPFDRRLSKETFGTNATTTHYLQSDIGLLAEADVAGSVTASYGWHPEHPYGSFPLFGRFGDTVGYYHNDQIGTPWRITDRSGNTLWSADYDPFGKATVDAQNSTVTNSLRFPGQYHDAETGLHYNDRRYYDPDTGRYLTRDPIGFEGGENLYAYARHNPVNLIDPTGEIVPWLAVQYLRCMGPCVLTAGIGNALANCGDPKLGQALKHCAIGCLFSLIPIPNPCGGFSGLSGKFGSWLGAGVGLASAALSAAFNSFPGETPVHARGEDGQPVLKAIADLRIGDEVLAWAEWKDGRDAYSYEKVTDTIASHKTQRLVHLALANGERITATEGHPFHTPEGWRDAILLKKGGQLLLKGGEGEGDSASAPVRRTVLIEEVSTETRVIPVFNLEVANSHTFLVGDDGAVVHNSSGVYVNHETYDGKTGYYAGQSNNIERREKEHQKNPRKSGVRQVCSISGISSKQGRDRLENFMFDTVNYLMGGSTNKRRPPNRGK